MIDIQRECPFCGLEIQVYDVTEPERRKVGLVYLRAGCPACGIRIEAAGIGGVDEALCLLDRQIAMRVGTKPEQWRIRPRKERKSRRRTR